MSQIWQYVVAAAAVLVLSMLMWSIYQIQHLTSALAADKKAKDDKALAETALEETSALFNKEFHEELRNRGRLHFEKIINENSMFLKQDLDMTIAQLNEYLKKEIGGKLNEEFADYTKAMHDAHELALESLHKSANAVDEQRKALVESLQRDVHDREELLLKSYEANMAKVVEHYILETLGDQFDLKAQMPFIMSQMEANKQRIMDDMRL